MSKLEEKIKSILQKKHITFIPEYQPPDLRAGLYRFDFYLPEFNTMLEINGSQHYIYTSHFYKSKSDFLKAQERDRRKISYCLARGIKLYIIPYWDIEHIHTLNDILNPTYLARSKFHNDEAYRSHFSKDTTH